MAVKKAAEAEAELKEEVQEEVPAAPEHPANVVIRIPRDREDREDKVVWVNERRYLIKRGIPVTVPWAVAEVLRHEEEMLQYIYDYESKVQK